MRILIVVVVVVLALVTAADAQVRLLNVGQGRSGETTAVTPDWMRVVPVRSAFEKALAKFRYIELGRAAHGEKLIPGLTGPCTPQGIARVSSSRVALSYHVDQPVPSGPAAAVVTIVDRTSGAVLAVRELADVDGTPLELHVGGIAAAGGWLWTGGAGRLLRFPIPDGPGRWLRAERSFALDTTVSFVSVSDGTLWAGDFYRDGEKPDGRGWAAGYRLDLTRGEPVTKITYARDGRTVLRPDRVIDLPTQVQGFAVCGDKVALSRSHGASDGELNVWKSPLASAPYPVSLPGGWTTSGWSLAERIDTIRLPSGPEDVEWHAPDLAIVFESGCEAYRESWRGRGGVLEDRFMFIKLQ